MVFLGSFFEEMIFSKNGVQFLEIMTRFSRKLHQTTFGVLTRPKNISSSYLVQQFPRYQPFSTFDLTPKTSKNALPLNSTYIYTYTYTVHICILLGTFLALKSHVTTLINISNTNKNQCSTDNLLAPLIKFSSGANTYQRC